MTADDQERQFDWGRGGAAALGMIAALVLFVMVALVSTANAAREQALSAERHSYDVALAVRNVSSNTAKAEAALARFVLDENAATSGAIYSNDWGLAGYQIEQLRKLVRGNPDQERRVRPLNLFVREAPGRTRTAKTNTPADMHHSSTRREVDHDVTRSRGPLRLD